MRCGVSGSRKSPRASDSGMAVECAFLALSGWGDRSGSHPNASCAIEAFALTVERVVVVRQAIRPCLGSLMMPGTMPSEYLQRRIDKLLAEAEEAADQENWERVNDLAQRILGIDTENDDAWGLLALAGGELLADSTPVVDSPQATSETVDTPASFANGRYTVQSLLGEGGKKKVYLAHDTTLDRDVAFGLIKAEGLDLEGHQRITREAQASARLGDHPNLMPIFDLGDENGQPFMVQPLMVGGDVGTLIEDAEDGMLTLVDALRISSEICRGLAFAHEKGIIHRDLKPGNVWLTDDGTVRIGDFGLALSLDRSRLTQEKMMVRTVSYMPPEQATGGDVTAQADLYSLGAMLSTRWSPAGLRSWAMTTLPSSASM
jgi:hypothetical protein